MNHEPHWDAAVIARGKRCASRWAFVGSLSPIPSRVLWSGCRDLNPGPLDPQSSALTKLRHSPWRTSLSKVLPLIACRADDEGMNLQRRARRGINGQVRRGMPSGKRGDEADVLRARTRVADRHVGALDHERGNRVERERHRHDGLPAPEPSEVARRGSTSRHPVPGQAHERPDRGVSLERAGPRTWIDEQQRDGPVPEPGATRAHHDLRVAGFARRGPRRRRRAERRQRWRQRDRNGEDGRQGDPVAEVGVSHGILQSRRPS